MRNHRPRRHHRSRNNGRGFKRNGSSGVDFIRNNVSPDSNSRRYSVIVFQSSGSKELSFSGFENVRYRTFPSVDLTIAIYIILIHFM